jgi:hypothetical protein
MLTNYLDAILRLGAAVLIALLTLGGPAVAQEVSLALLRPETIATAPMPTPVEPVTQAEAPIHRFWDRKNSALFAMTAAFTTADFFVTRANLQTGGQEFNPVTRLYGSSTAGLAANFVGETVGVVGISYLFHKTGHHKLERAVFMVNIGSSAAAVSFGLAHR